MKQCSLCGKYKPLTDFYKRKDNKSGYRNDCKKCLQNRRKKYYYDNQQDAIDYSRNWYLDNKDSAILATTIWHKNNPEKTRAYKRKWKINNPDAVLEADRKRRILEKNNEYLTVTDRFYKNLYSSCCVVCRSKVNIQADHVIPVSRGGRHSEGNLQPLCALCNQRKNNKLMIEFKIYLRNFR